MLTLKVGYKLSNSIRQRRLKGAQRKTSIASQGTRHDEEQQQEEVVQADLGGPRPPRDTHAAGNKTMTPTLPTTGLQQPLTSSGLPPNPYAGGNPPAPRLQQSFTSSPFPPNPYATGYPLVPQSNLPTYEPQKQHFQNEAVLSEVVIWQLCLNGAAARTPMMKRWWL